MDRQSTIKAIEDYAEATGLKPSTICQYAVQNRNAYERLVSGSLSVRTAERITDWIEANQPSADPQEAKTAGAA